MRIPHDLPQFKDAPALIAVLGKSEGVFYVVHRGVITKSGKIKEEKPRYSDREGFFMQSRGGKYLGSGSVYENKNNETMRRFSKKVAEALRKSMATGRFKEIFLFEPAYAAGGTFHYFPKALRARVRAVIDGEYVKSHPCELLLHIRHAIDSKPSATSPESVKDRPRAKEARVILARARSARGSVIRGKP